MKGKQRSSSPNGLSWSSRSANQPLGCASPLPESLYTSRNMMAPRVWLPTRRTQGATPIQEAHVSRVQETIHQRSMSQCATSAKTRISRTVVYWYVELRNNLKVAALLQPLFGKVSSRNVVFMLLFLPDFAEFLEVRKVENGDGKRK